MRVNIDGSTRWPSLRINFEQDKVSVPAKFTMSAQYKYADAEFAAQAGLRPAMRLGRSDAALPSFNNYTISNKNRADVWLSYDKNPTFTLDKLEENHCAVALQLVFDLPESKPIGTILVDNIELYYIPTDKTDYKVISAVYPTVTVGAPEGIDANAVLALTAEPQKYFGTLVDKCVIDGNTITLTVNGVGQVKLPAVVNADQTKTYNSATANVEKIDEFAPWRGVQLIDENFESFKVGETFSTEKTNPHETRTFANEGKGTTGELVENVQGVGNGKYVKVNFTGETKYPLLRVVLENAKDASTGERVEDYVRIPATYTMGASVFFDDAETAEKIAPRLAVRSTDAYDAYIHWETKSKYASNAITSTVSVEDESKTVREILVALINGDQISGSAYIDDVKLYYKPIAQDAYGDITVNYPTITVNAPNGIEEKAVEAIKANPTEYLSCAVSEVEFTDTQMIITLNETEAVNYAYIKIPALVNAAKDKTYPETKIELPDYYSVLYGLRNYLWNAGNKNISETGKENQSYYASYSFKNTEGFDYISLVSKVVQYPRSLNYTRDASKPYDTNHTYTYISKGRFSGISCVWLRKVNTSAEPYNVDKRISKPQDNTWNDIVFKDYTIEATPTPGASLPDIYVGSTVYNDGKGTGINADVAYIGLYYRPIAQDNGCSKAFSGNTVTVTYANGIDANTAKALEVYYAKYFDGKVTALTVNGNDVVMTLADGVTEITVPSLVNAAGTAKYNAVTVNTAVYPTSLSDETTIRAVYPAGLRFKASVKTNIMEDADLTEFGYVVAREEQRAAAGVELKADIDPTVLKTIVSPSFKRVDGKVTINKYEGGVEDTTFAAVLVNIPSDRYADEFAVRPYVVYGGQYFYGDTMTESILNIANTLKDGATGDVLDVVNKIINGEKLDEYNG